MFLLQIMGTFYREVQRILRHNHYLNDRKPVMSALNCFHIPNLVWESTHLWQVSLLHVPILTQ